MSYTLFEIEGLECLYDLSNGSLVDEMIGQYDDDIPIYSAEKLLIDLECIDEATIRKITVNENNIKWEAWI